MIRSRRPGGPPLLVLALCGLIIHFVIWRAAWAAVAFHVDWEVVLAVALGLGALGTVALEYRRSSKLDELAHDLVDRVARLEATSTDAMTVEQRIASLEVKAERDEMLEERMASIGERVASIEATRDLSERIARLEALSEHETEEEETEE